LLKGLIIYMAENRDDTIGTAVQDTADELRGGVTRRAVLRGATAAVPTILTLNAGSAAAMTSAALITPSNAPEGNNYLCLSGEVLAGIQSGKYLIDPAFVPLEDGDITEIPADVTFYYEKNGTLVATPLAMCDPEVSQTKFWYKDSSYGPNSGWNQTGDVRKGLIASCEALQSLDAISSCAGDV
jgi:hypothetical protein